jgi:hypothetical protein
MAMKIEINAKAHEARASVLLQQLVSDAFESFDEFGLERSKSRELAKHLLFRICAVLDGSSYPGTLGDHEIAPFVGFYLADENDDTDTDTEDETVLVPESGSGMHGMVDEFVDAFIASKRGDRL